MRRQKIMSILLICVLGLCSCGNPRIAELQKQLEELQTENEELNVKLEQLEEGLITVVPTEVPMESPAVSTSKPTARPVTKPGHTATPKPTEMVKLTATPRPTTTPKPTATVRPTTTPQPTATLKPTTVPIAPLQVTRHCAEAATVDGVEPYSEHWFMNMQHISADLSSASALAFSLTFSNATVFPGEDKLPKGYEPETLLEWGKYPGLNIDILHKYGFTGKGSVVAYVDQPIRGHEQYDNINLHYINNTDNDSSMHGPAVLSLLAGEDIGTAPEAEVYYYAHSSWYADQTTHAECLYQIIEQNKHLPKDKKITMVGFSDNIDPSEKNMEAFETAVKACEDAGIMVWFCGEYAPAMYFPYSDKNNYQNLVPDHWWGNHTSENVYVPSAGRTTAQENWGGEYIYWASGGLSWTMPYVLGLYGIANEINPELTQNELRTLLKETAYKHNGMNIVNPVGFISEVLRNVGRKAEAQAMQDEVIARTKYIYAIMDTTAMSEADLKAVADYLASITDATVLVVDAAYFANAEELYTAMRQDAKERGGTVAGVQIFGTASMVPAFDIKYKVQMIDGVDEGGIFLSDLFYGNFENDSEEISSGYNVMDHFEEDWDVTLAPNWPVVRLPLSKGEYSAFFEKYTEFAQNTGLEQLNLVNFSNPIFKQSNHTDDMGSFINRMENEFGLLDVPYRLYGNLKGQYPVNTDVKGGFVAENLKTENDKGIAEFIINSHGQWNNIDQCYFENGEEIRESLINMETINEVLDSNPYYLDCWTCLNGYGMENNLTTTALTGECVGMFSATTIISNNGVDCNASVPKMEKSNFYYFYYSYLKSLHEGASRSEAFYKAQRAYAQVLLNDSKNGIRIGEGNYQFNLYNLLAYHNFGVLEPNRAVAAFQSHGYIEQAGQSVPKETVVQGGNATAIRSNVILTDGEPIGTVKDIKWQEANHLTKGNVTIERITAQKLDNGYIRFSVDCTVTPMQWSAFNPPNGDKFMLIGEKTSGEREQLVYDIAEKDVKEVDMITMRFGFDDTNKFFLFFQTNSLTR